MHIPPDPLGPPARRRGLPLALLAALLWASGCPDENPPEGTCAPEVDLDGDGVCLSEDCDDGSASVGGPTSWYVDQDGDGFGAGDGTLACDAPSGTVDLPGDCDDADGAIHPGAHEACDGHDEDCDGAIDEGGACGPTATPTEEGGQVSPSPHGPTPEPTDPRTPGGGATPTATPIPPTGPAPTPTLGPPATPAPTAPPGPTPTAAPTPPITPSPLPGPARWGSAVLGQARFR